jgi:hypothetical protein
MVTACDLEVAGLSAAEVLAFFSTATGLAVMAFAGFGADSARAAAARPGLPAGAGGFVVLDAGAVRAISSSHVVVQDVVTPSLRTRLHGYARK